jgi:hypothetical protein
MTVAFVALAVAACDARPSWEREALGREYFDPSGSYGYAGVSTRMRADIEPLDPSTLQGDSSSADVHLYQMRCGACHQVPDPRMKAPEHWAYLVRRMRGKAEGAGLMPMTDAEGDTIVALLRAHARR